MELFISTCLLRPGSSIVLIRSIQTSGIYVCLSFLQSSLSSKYFDETHYFTSPYFESATPFTTCTRGPSLTALLEIDTEKISHTHTYCLSLSPQVIGAPDIAQIPQSRFHLCCTVGIIHLISGFEKKSHVSETLIEHRLLKGAVTSFCCLEASLQFLFFHLS